MTSRIWYRLASMFFLLFAAGHTAGFLRLRAPTPEAQAVRAAMDSVHFQMRGAELSFGGFYVGFGLFVSAYLLFAALVAWQLGRLSETTDVAPIGWGLFAVQLVSVALSAIYFTSLQVIFSLIAAALVGAGLITIRLGHIVQGAHESVAG